MGKPSKLDELAAAPPPGRSWQPSPELLEKAARAQANGWGMQRIVEALTADTGQKIGRDRLARLLAEMGK